MGWLTSLSFKKAKSGCPTSREFQDITTIESVDQCLSMGYDRAMANQSMLHIAAVIGGSVFLKEFIRSWWDSYKKKVEQNGIPLRRNRKGVYVARGHVRIIEGIMSGVAWVAFGLFMFGLATRIIMGPS